MTTYKVLDENMRSMHGGSAKWTPGRKKTVKGDIIPCVNGLHYCRDEVELLTWLGPVICECEISVEHVDAYDKGVARWIRIAEPNPYWNERTARHFACDCAEHALPYAGEDDRELLQACIDISRAYADWPEEWGAAREAAWAATWATWATWAAAWEDTWAAARAAARAATRAAAREAARADIAVIFATYLSGTSEWVCEQKGER